MGNLFLNISFFAVLVLISGIENKRYLLVEIEGAEGSRRNDCKGTSCDVSRHHDGRRNMNNVHVARNPCKGCSFFCICNKVNGSCRCPGNLLGRSLSNEGERELHNNHNPSYI